MADYKETPPAELSLKFIAWNIKSIDESLKRLVQAVEGHTNSCTPSRKSNDEDIGF